LILVVLLRAIIGPTIIDRLISINAITSKASMIILLMAFMSASGFSIDNGFTVGNIYECELKRKVVKKAKKVIMLMDTSKINKDMPFTYSTLNDIDIWICEKVLPEDLVNEAREQGVEIL
jgi:DeoR/GlpR family transcriptional regulator of sugar metabolism